MCYSPSTILNIKEEGSFLPQLLVLGSLPGELAEHGKADSFRSGTHASEQELDSHPCSSLLFYEVFCSLVYMGTQQGRNDYCHSLMKNGFGEDS